MGGEQSPVPKQSLLYIFMGINLSFSNKSVIDITLLGRDFNYLYFEEMRHFANRGAIF